MDPSGRASILGEGQTVVFIGLFWGLLGTYAISKILGAGLATL